SKQPQHGSAGDEERRVGTQTFGELRAIAPEARDRAPTSSSEMHHVITQTIRVSILTSLARSPVPRRWPYS
ncbi:MAG: hypothetical protein AAGB13_04715, partial [Cyanobacteria bacterium P01_F01_bin.33]